MYNGQYKPKIYKIMMNYKKIDIGGEHFYGVGINNFEGNVSIKKKYIKSYIQWKNMLQRCYSKKYHEMHPTYIGCTVCNEWLFFSNFKEWYDFNYRNGYQLDKDILFNGNKIYSPNTCVFVPREINSLFVKSDSTRGVYPIGVYYNKAMKIFVAQITIDNKAKCIGRYPTPEEAFNAYKIAKETNVHTMAFNYFNLGKIGLNVYNAMINYTVNYDD